jgi:hypothetical protein
MIKNIQMTATPSLFTSEKGALSESLCQDIHGYDADSVSITFHYQYKNIVSKVQNKIESLMGSAGKYTTFQVVGRSDDDFDMIFNSKEVVLKINININKNEYGVFDPEAVIEALIEKIQANDQV